MTKRDSEEGKDLPESLESSSNSGRARLPDLEKSLIAVSVVNWAGEATECTLQGGNAKSGTHVNGLARARSRVGKG